MCKLRSSFVRLLAAVILLLLGLSRTADAQIYYGEFGIYRNGSVVGAIRVAPHADAAAPYREEWIALSDAVDDPDATIVIAPFDGPADSNHAAFLDVQNRPESMPRTMEARRRDFARDDWHPGGDLRAECGRAIEPGAVRSTRTIWQYDADSSDAELVGFVLATGGRGAEGSQLFCLTDQFTYLSPTGPVTELRPANADDVTTVLSQLSADVPGAHGIQVDPAPPSRFGCGVAGRDGDANGVVAVSILVLAIYLARRRRGSEYMLSIEGPHTR